MESNDIDTAIRDIQERNKRVEADKAWETSAIRRLIICVLTYIIAAAWLVSIHDTNPYLKAFVPVAGWLLSTLTLPVVKKWWIKNHHP
ncbi:MAG: hypothetical protein AAB932_05135 [Patescibacteria group bacterium]